MSRKVTVLFYVAVFALAAGPALGSVGSIISSFWVADNWYSFAYGVARDGTYLCWVKEERSPAYGLKYVNYGGGSGTVYIGAFPAGHGDADASILGPGYFADIYTVGGVQTITDYDLADGSIVGSWAPLNAMIGYAYNPALGIRYVNDESGYLYRYDAAGSILSSFRTGIPGGIGATSEFAGNQGEYVIATGGGSWSVYDSAGTQIEVVLFPWEHSSLHECACGPGYPSGYGTTLWCNVEIAHGDTYLCQISLHNATSVEPASVGRIKALYR
jgi:hypothetical protein